MTKNRVTKTEWSEVTNERYPVDYVRIDIYPTFKQVIEIFKAWLLGTEYQIELYHKTACPLVIKPKAKILKLVKD